MFGKKKQKEVCAANQNLNECEIIAKIREMKAELATLSKQDRNKVIADRMIHFNRYYTDVFRHYVAFIRDIKRSSPFESYEHALAEFGRELDKIDADNARISVLEHDIKEAQESLGI